MEVRSDSIPSSYRQPGRDYVGRDLEGSLEKVDYIPKTHLRIWYNTQTDDYQLHHHAAMEIILVEENDYDVTANGERIRLQPGDILFIPPHMLHELRHIDDGVRFIMLVDLTPLQYFQDYSALQPIFLHPYLLNAKTRPGIYPEIRKLFDQAIHDYFENDLTWESSVYLRLCEIIRLIGREHLMNQASREVAVEQMRDDYERMSSVLSYLNEHYSENISLEDAASIAGFSKFYFTRLFKNGTHMTFTDYLTRRRISASQAMLSTNMPITDIAFRAGFNSLTTFNRSFKKYTGCSPSEYRDRLRNDNFHEDPA